MTVDIILDPDAPRRQPILDDAEMVLSSE